MKELLKFRLKKKTRLQKIAITKQRLISGDVSSIPQNFLEITKMEDNIKFIQTIQGNKNNKAKRENSSSKNNKNINNEKREK